MKYLLILMYFIATSNAIAHEDHALGENVHFAYHITYWSLCAIVAFKGFV